MTLYCRTIAEARRVRRAAEELTQGPVSVRVERRARQRKCYVVLADGWGDRWGDALLAYLATGKFAKTATVDNVRPFLAEGSER